MPGGSWIWDLGNSQSRLISTFQTKKQYVGEKLLRQRNLGLDSNM